MSREQPLFRSNLDVNCQQHKLEEAVRKNDEDLYNSSCDERARHGNIAKRSEYDSRRRRSSQNRSERDYACIPNERERSKDMNFYEKDARFESDRGHGLHRTEPQNRALLRNSNHDNGLRNALSNLECCLNTSFRTAPSSTHNMPQLGRLEEKVPSPANELQRSKHLNRGILRNLSSLM